MTALALTPQPSTASILLTITGAPAGAVVVTRTDANGTTTVRLREDDEPIAGTLIVTDYEAAMVGSITYDVVDSASVTTTQTTALDLTGAAPIIAAVQLPSISHTPPMVTGYDASQSSATVVHWPVDRGDPIVITKPARTREGTLTVFAESYEAAHAALAVVRPGYQLMFRQADHPGLDMYFVVVRSDIAPLELVHQGWAWSVVAQFVEIRSPNTPLLGAVGWSFDDVTAGYSDFSAVRSAFDDFAALTVGPL